MIPAAAADALLAAMLMDIGSSLGRPIRLLLGLPIIVAGFAVAARAMWRVDDTRPVAWLPQTGCVLFVMAAVGLVTPSLHEQLSDNDDELRHLVQFISARVAGEEEAPALTDEVMRAIPKKGYAWPGNFRELEQCVRSVMLRGTYHARPAAVHTDARHRIADNIVSGRFTADDLLRHYCTLLYATSRNYSTVAETLALDRRTVRAKIDPHLLRECPSVSAASSADAT